MEELKKELELYKKSLEREKKARTAAETLLEEKSRELFALNRKLKASFGSLKQAHESLKKAQSKIVQSEKMASVGVLAAGVAHEINNPVGYIQSNLDTLNNYSGVLINILKLYKSKDELLSKSTEEEKNKLKQVDEEITKIRADGAFQFMMEDLENLIKESLEGTSRIRDIVSALKEYSHVDSVEFKPIDLNRCIETTLKVYENELKYSADIRTNLGEIEEFIGNAGEISQVIGNLVNNAAQAMDDRGLIEIFTEQKDRNITFKVKDNGGGIDESILSKIFDPFFTTKEVGKGTGLGLSVCKEIIEKHGGEVNVKSEKGKGTEFEIIFDLNNSIKPEHSED